jgi:6-phosphogluconolactonase/glucosamine-6-phosphate isomerase/deaminase
LGKGIQVAVATFSTQTGMIERVMKEAIPHPRSTEIHVFGGDDYVEGYSKGKQSQLLLAMNSFNDQEQVKSNGRAREPIIPSATILIDDDTDNIEVALEDGYKTFAFLPDTPSSFLHMSL